MADDPRKREARQREAVQRLQARLRFELLVLRRLEKRGRDPQSTALGNVLRRARERAAGEVTE